MVCLAVHIFVPFMIISMLDLIGSWELGFLRSGGLIGVTLCALVWGVNHITNPNGFCWLTHIENHYREKFKKGKCNKDFLPRFYSKCGQIFRGNFKDIPL